MGVGGERILDDFNIVGVGSRCHSTESILKMKKAFGYEQAEAAGMCWGCTKHWCPRCITATQV